jgi:hypothetical protein
MKEITRYILICAMSLLAIVGCDVHEFPDPKSEELVPYTLHLNFYPEMPLYDTIRYDARGLLTRDGESGTKAPNSEHDIRYTIKAYRTDNVIGESRIPDTTFVFTRDLSDDLNYVANFSIQEGTYDFRVWCDYVAKGSTADKYYTTDSFDKIQVKMIKNESGIEVEKQYATTDGEIETARMRPDSILCGSSDYRDAFRGWIKERKVINPKYYKGEVVNTIKNYDTVNLIRPLGKYVFISTDVGTFISRLAKKMQKAGTMSSTLSEAEAFSQILSSFDPNRFRVIFRYGLWMPCYYNMFIDKPGSSWSDSDFLSKFGDKYDSEHELIFESRMEINPENSSEMILGFDYLIVNGQLGVVNSVSVEVYDMEDGELMSRSKPIDVRYVRSKRTIITGEFLTSVANGGVSISPGFDGPDYQVPLLPLSCRMEIR